MSKTKRYLESQQFSEPENIPSELEGISSGFIEIGFDELKLEQILFRRKNFDSSEVFSQVGCTQITAITYLVGKGFSQSLLNLVKQAAPNVSLKIAFNFIDKSGNNPGTKNSTKDINKLIGAFQQLFINLPEYASIEVIVTTDNHIKLLHFDDQLMIGSMNLSQTADGLTQDKLLKEQDGTPSSNYRNHELICRFSGNAQSVAEQVFEQLARTDNAVTLVLKKCDYFKQLFRTCSKLMLSPLVFKETIEHHQQASHRELEKNIRSLLEEILSAFLVVELDIVSSDVLNDFDYEDLVALHSRIVDYSVEMLIDFIQEYACFISRDLNEIPEVCKDIQDLWNSITDQLTDSCLDLEQLRNKIIEDRHDNDLDDGESEPVFGPKSQEIYLSECAILHRELKEILLEVMKAIPAIGNEIGGIIYESELYQLS